MSHTITTTNFISQSKATAVREVYTINDELLVMVATDRLSAFDGFTQKEFRTKVKF
jgi:phosphoribosylaminoimidazole-succinocarboxamide synthase